MTAPGEAGSGSPQAPEAVPADGHAPAGVAAVPPALPVKVVGAAGLAADRLGDSAVTWQRLSPRSLVVRPLTDLVRLLPLLAGLLLLHAQTGGGLVWGVIASCFAVVTGLVHWGTTRFLVTGERVYLRRGLVSKKVLSVARDRIRTVDISAHPLHRVLGVCRVSIGTGRNDLRSGERFHLDGLTRPDAEALRALLLSGRTVPRPEPLIPAQAQAQATAPAPAPAAPPPLPPRPAPEHGEELARLRMSWLRFAPLTMTGLVVLGVLLGSVIQITNATDVNLAKTSPVRAIIDHFAALSFGQRLVVGLAVAIAGYTVIAVAGYVAVFWRFRLVRHGGDTLRVTRGLLSVRATTISLARLRGVEISEPLLLRAARGARCIAITTGLLVGRGAEREGSVVLPPAPRDIARRVASDVLGVPADLCAGELRRHGPAARRRRYVRALLIAAVVTAAVDITVSVRHGPAWIWVGSLAIWPAALAAAEDRYRNLGHRLAGPWLVTSVGSLARRRCILGTDAVIGWRIHQTWFQRRQGLMTLTATTAAGQQHYSVRDVPVGEGLALATAATGDLLRPFLRDHGALAPQGPGKSPRSPTGAGPHGRI